MEGSPRSSIRMDPEVEGSPRSSICMDPEVEGSSRSSTHGSSGGGVTS